MKTDELRKLYLDFFKARGHKAFPSDSLIPADDPSLLFTGAGMNQFKPYFLGLKKDVKRATSSQKCLRTADLEQVGKTAYHHTFFEMLGNFSFGDYFKEEAIAWGWEFVTQSLKLSPSKIWVSVYEEDDEAYNIWKNKIRVTESRIVRMGAHDNFWPANARVDGPNGPCGPCSEIYVSDVAGKGVEIWNLVFTQFDRQSDGSLVNLPRANIDTGMGLERTSAVLQDVKSNFDIDIFRNIRGALKTLLKKDLGLTAHENAVMDHLRASIFAIADGAMPSNEGRGYVIRKLLRLASDHLEKAGVRAPGLLHELVPAVIQVMRVGYPELVAQSKDVARVVENEERAYLEIMELYLPKLKNELSQIKKDSGDPGSAQERVADSAFRYYDSHGLSFDLISQCAESVGLSLERKLFDKRLDEQKNRSRERSKIAGEIFAKNDREELVRGLPATAFLGYEKLEAKAKLLFMQDNLLIFDQSPFYAESGGQVGDTGTITDKESSAEVLGTQMLGTCIAHTVNIRKGSLQIGKEYWLQVDAARRSAIMKNHTATHLLHSALRKVLGGHVKQNGSLVAPERLRFDFTHFSALNQEELEKVEELVNQEIKKNNKLVKVEMSKAQAVSEGAMAFFGDKYGDRVRVVSAGDFSKELCGGTHLDFTGEIKVFKILSESSIQAGVRRIEAVTGEAALSLMRREQNELDEIAKAFGGDRKTLSDTFKKSRERLASLKSILVTCVEKKVQSEMVARLESLPLLHGMRLVVREVNGADAEMLKGIYTALKKANQPFVSFLISELDEKIALLVAASEDVVKKGFHAGNLIKDIASLFDGNGGGRPDFAIGGGRALDKKNERIQKGIEKIKESLGKIGGVS